MSDAAQELLERITPLVKDPELAAWITDELIRCRAQAEQLRELERERDKYGSQLKSAEEELRVVIEQLRELQAGVLQVAEVTNEPWTTNALLTLLDRTARGGTTE